jgi:hypothetical protein
MNDYIERAWDRLNASLAEKAELERASEYVAWIACRLTKLAMALGEGDISEERVALTATTLMEVEPLRLDLALMRAQRECTTFPKPVEIFDFLREMQSHGGQAIN